MSATSPSERSVPPPDLPEPGIPPRRLVDDALRRALDIVGALVGLVILGILVPPVGIAIMLESGGPVFFASRRYGRGQRGFMQWKFRTMYRDAEARLEEVRQLSNTNGPSFKSQRDPRVTRVGRILRKTSIDELPQLVNVLRGEMSLVGPRPVQDIDFRGYPNALTRRSYVRPGMTGLWQVMGRSTLPFAEMMRLDLEYVDEASIGLNLRVLARTIPAVLSQRGAY